MELKPCPFCGGEGNGRYIEDAIKAASDMRKQIDHLTQQCQDMDGITASQKIRALQRENDRLRSSSTMSDEQRSHLTRLLEEALEVCVLSWEGYLNEYGA